MKTSHAVLLLALLFGLIFFSGCWPTEDKTKPPQEVVLFSDNFTQPNSGWPVITTGDPNKKISFVTGEYKVEINKTIDPAKNYLVLISAPVQNFKQYTVSVDAVTFSTIGTYGIVFNFISFDKDYYIFSVSPAEGKYRLLLKYGTGIFPSPIIDDTASDAISYSTNILKVRQDGSSVKLYINETLVAVKTIPDPKSSSDPIGVGIMAGCTSTPTLPIEMNFNNFLLTGLANGAVTNEKGTPTELSF
jgi:hypothetical protein